MARRGFTGVMMKSFGVKDHDITVVGTEELASHFRRIRFRADTLFSDAQPGATAWVRIWFPDNDPDNEGAEHQRAYTFTEANDDTGEFACDFVLHGPAGPASAWARTAAKGMTLQAQSNGPPSSNLTRTPPATSSSAMLHLCQVSMASSAPSPRQCRSSSTSRSTPSTTATFTSLTIHA